MRRSAFLLTVLAALGTFADVCPAERPVGVFDSGIGGLSVLERLLTLDAFDNRTGEAKPDGRPDFENEDFVYFGDQANMPYGRYDAAGKADFLRELVVRDARFVLGSEGHEPSKIVVIACNTATAYGLKAVQDMPRPHDAPVIGVVNAGVEAALDALSGATEPYTIAVMATPGTISSGVYDRTIQAELRRRAVPVRVGIASHGGAGLAEAVENRDPGMNACARTNLLALVEGVRTRGGAAPIRALILGCTHYPYVLDAFKWTLDELRKDPKYAPYLADDIVFVDPAVYTAKACYRLLAEKGLLKSSDAPHAAKRVKAFISVGTAGPLSDAVKYGRSCGAADLGTKIVPFAEAGVGKDVCETIGRIFPTCGFELGL